MHVIYTLPYQPLGTPLEVPLDYALNGRVDVTISPISVDGAVTVAGQSVPALAAQGGETSDVRVFGGEASAPAGATLRLELRGEISAPQSASQSGSDSAASASAAPTSAVSRDLLVGILIGAGLGLVLLGAFFLVKDRLALRSPANSDGPLAADKETLVAELAALDERFGRGEISKAEYDSRRDQLKKQLARLMRG
ncbi:MAG: hypothetical protein IT323_11340 [Anaerolineae bacterium]|nr:hypothetical protein [Anaerolineae bacterium]